MMIKTALLVNPDSKIKPSMKNEFLNNQQLIFVSIIKKEATDQKCWLIVYAATCRKYSDFIFEIEQEKFL